MFAQGGFRVLMPAPPPYFPTFPHRPNPLPLLGLRHSVADCFDFLRSVFKQIPLLLGSQQICSAQTEAFNRPIHDDTNKRSCSYASNDGDPHRGSRTPDGVCNGSLFPEAEGFQVQAEAEG